MLRDDQWKWSPDPARWSIGEIVEHLVLSEESVGRVQKGFRKEEPMFHVIPRPLRRTLILGALRRDVTLPLPSPDMEPCGNAPRYELLSRWDLMRRNLRTILNAQRDGERAYWHPVLGPLTPLQMLVLGQVHTAYHARQIDSLQSTIGFPQDC